MNYSIVTHMCRVEFFRESGKWYTAEAVSFDGLYNEHPVRAFDVALWRHLEGRLAGMWAVCFDPYSEHAYPQMTRVPAAKP